ncbi:MAG: acyl carrier protein [Clostridia bacterium]|nr:acyl carrier protein [Clostridia bacterium]
MAARQDRKEILSKTTACIASVLSVPAEPMNEDTSFTADLVVDSLLMYEIVIELEDLFDMRISDSDIDRIETIGDIVDFVLAYRD